MVSSVLAYEDLGQEEEGDSRSWGARRDCRTGPGLHPDTWFATSQLEQVTLGGTLLLSYTPNLSTNFCETHVFICNLKANGIQ